MAGLILPIFSYSIRAGSLPLAASAFTRSSSRLRAFFGKQVDENFAHKSSSGIGP
jgi:hypothetical protein